MAKNEDLINPSTNLIKPDPRVSLFFNECPTLVLLLSLPSLFLFLFERFQSTFGELKSHYFAECFKTKFLFMGFVLLILLTVTKILARSAKTGGFESMFYCENT